MVGTESPRVEDEGVGAASKPEVARVGEVEADAGSASDAQPRG